MADCGCDTARTSMEDYLHGETDETTKSDIADHLACCPPCEQEWRVGVRLSVNLQRACCEQAPTELKESIVNTLRQQ